MTNLWDNHTVPLSCYGSWHAVQTMEADGEMSSGLYLKTFYHEAWQKRMCRISVLHQGEECAFQTKMYPTELKLETIYGEVKLCFSIDGSLYFCSRGLDLQLEFIKATQVWEQKAGRYQVNCSPQNTRVIISSRLGNLRLQTEWKGDHAEYIRFHLETDSSGYSEGNIDFYHAVTVCEDRQFVSYNEPRQIGVLKWIALFNQSRCSLCRFDPSVGSWM